MILSLEKSTRHVVPEGFASTLPFTAFWISMPTFGSGLRELFIALKGFTCGVFLSGLIITMKPSADWVSILSMAIAILFSSFISEETKKTVAYMVSSLMMQYMIDKSGTDYMYCLHYFFAILIALAFGTAAFFIPFVRWSSGNAKHYMLALGNVLSIKVQGVCSSFWTRTYFERDLNMTRLRQLRTTAEKCIEKIEVSMSESDYEPLFGNFRAKMRVRFAFCKKIHAIIGSMIQVIELIVDKPSLVATPTCLEYGAAIEDELSYITSSIDSMILKILDTSRNVDLEVEFFREAHARFQESLSRIREDVILNNENYETDQSDVFLGFFMFSVDQLCEVVGSFSEDPSPQNSIAYLLLFPVRDVKSVIRAFKTLFAAVVYNQTITRRLKESIKLTLCMVVPVLFQIYAMSNNPTSAVAGASIIALIYNPTGSASFHYATGRLQGTVLGSIAAYMSVEIADRRLMMLYAMVFVLSFIGGFVQAAPNYYALGNAIVCSTISVVTQYTNSAAAMTRINQNCFAIVFYFVIACTLWPMHGTTKIRMDLDVSLRCFRESSTRLLCNLDMPYDFSEVVADSAALLEEMSSKIASQLAHIPGAIEEPSLSSAEFPEEAWRKVIQSENKLHSALSMMCLAYSIFMSSSPASQTSLSVHWVALHRIAPHAKDLSDLIFSAVDLHLMIFSKSVVVPTSHFTRLHTSMIETYEAILDIYIETIHYRTHETEETKTDLFSEINSDYSQSRSHSSKDDDEGDGSPTRSLLGEMKPEKSPIRVALGKQDITGGRQASFNDTHAKPVESIHSPRDGHSTYSAGEDASEHGTRRRKKMSYISYKPTSEELQMMRNFVSGTNLALPQTNPNALAASVVAPCTNLSFNKPPEVEPSRVLTVSNDVKLMAMTGFDDTMIKKLRKKHGIATAKDLTDDKKAPYTLADSFTQSKFTRGDIEDIRGSTLNLFDNNASFKKHLTGSFFPRVNRDQDKLGNTKKAEQSMENSFLSSDKSEGGPLSKKKDCAKASQSAIGMKVDEMLDNTVYEGQEKEVRGDGDVAGDRDTRSIPHQLVNLTVEEGEGEGLKHVKEDIPAQANKADAINNVFTASYSSPAAEGANFDTPAGILLLSDNLNLAKESPDAPQSMMEEKKKENTNATGGARAFKTSASIDHNSCSTEKKNSSNNPHTEKGILDMTMNRTIPSRCFQSKKSREGHSVNHNDQESYISGGKDFDNDMFDLEKGIYALTNRDIHSMEAFLFGIRAIVTYMNELQNSLIQIQHENELSKKL
ncbi:unnamed protein product [Phytomonas sp. Hart1]|nr:unnamed protein product [Phytomonas sp. Hart1]|eukprot:CCW70281.1 unnamed protein product [Phytomonas sp. isolate Hart1]